MPCVKTNRGNDDDDDDEEEEEKEVAFRFAL